MRRERRPHQKTRTGCTNCKNRRVKCDERKPICGNCSRRPNPDQCSFLISCPLASNSITPSSKSSDGTATPQAGQEESAQQPPRYSYYTQEDLELLHHYTALTAQTLHESHRQLEVWQVALPQMGFSFHFLINQIFAVAALHKCYLLGKADLPVDIGLVSSAATHMNTALAGFRSEFQNVTSENCGALMGFSILLAVYLFASLRHGSNPFRSLAHGAPSIGLLEWFQLIRSGMRMTWHSRERAWIIDSPVGKLLPKSDWRDDLRPQTTEEIAADARLAKLESLWKTEGPEMLETEASSALSEPQLQALSNTLKLLRLTYLRASLATRNQLPHPGGAEDGDVPFRRRSAVISWIYVVDEAFVTMLQERNCYALIILAHYCPLFSKVPHTWWIEGLADDMMHFAVNGLESNLSWIEVPMSQMGIE